MSEYYVNREGDTYLEHHGIKGQKWGVRRFQRPDGTLTPAGRRRQATMDTAMEKTQKMKKLAEEDSERWGNLIDRMKKGERDDLVRRGEIADYVSINELERWKRGSDAQIKRYQDRIDRMANTKVAELSKKDMRHVEKYIKNATHTRSDMEDWYDSQTREWRNEAEEGTLETNRRIIKRGWAY